MAWRGSARAAITAAKPGRTPALHRRTPRTAQHPGDDGTGAASTAPASGLSQARARVSDKDHSSPEIANRRRRFSTRSRRVAICQRRKRSTEPRGQIDRSSRGGSGGIGGEVRGARRWPEHGGGHGGDTVATRIARGLGFRERERGERASETGRTGLVPPNRVWTSLSGLSKQAR
jgi:hypothetical protein